MRDQEGVPQTSERRRSSGDLFPSDSDPFRLSPHGLESGVARVSPALSRYSDPSAAAGGAKGVSERTPLLGRQQSISFAPDGIGVTAATGAGESNFARRRSSAATSAARKKRPHDVGESTNGQTVRYVPGLPLCIILWTGDRMALNVCD